MGDPRPLDYELSQAQQAALLTDTGNSPTATEADEAALLEAEFGPADATGVYGSGAA